MTDLLIRNLGDSTRMLLKEQARRHGRSQQGEARAILESSLHASDSDWVARLRNVSTSTGGIELDVPVRHRAREIDTSGWL